jgi:hypothetical protein
VHGWDVGKMDAALTRIAVRVAERQNAIDYSERSCQEAIAARKETLALSLRLNEELLAVKAELSESAANLKDMIWERDDLLMQLMGVAVRHNQLEDILEELVAIHGFPGGAHNVRNTRMERAWTNAFFIVTKSK